MLFEENKGNTRMHILYLSPGKYSIFTMIEPPFLILQHADPVNLTSSHSSLFSSLLGV